MLEHQPYLFSLFPTGLVFQQRSMQHQTWQPGSCYSSSFDQGPCLAGYAMSKGALQETDFVSQADRKSN